MGIAQVASEALGIMERDRDATTHNACLLPDETRNPKLNCGSNHSLPQSSNKEGLPRQPGYPKELILTNRYSPHQCYKKTSTSTQQILRLLFNWSCTSEPVHSKDASASPTHKGLTSLQMVERNVWGTGYPRSERVYAIHLLHIYWD